MHLTSCFDRLQLRADSVTTSTKNIDFRGARGSNAGDQFHELWALLQVLELLRPDTDLKAVGVEGVKTETVSQQPDDPTWDSVDCALYYGGTSLATADRIEFAQLKYSAANPDKAWTVSRLTESTAIKVNNSIIRKMANDFRSAKVRVKPGAQLKILLISNQALSGNLKNALEARWSGPVESAGIDQAILADLHSLKVATGLDEAEFQQFLETLDFGRCGAHSRFALEEKVVSLVTELLGSDVSSEVKELQVEVRKLMMPERAGEIITDKEVLSWFGLSGREGLFPCPPDVRIPERVVIRSASDEAVSLLLKSERLILVHGVGGCGKTTLMRQIADRLPKGSVTVFFDCFGGGRYEYSDDKRHLPENAFLHLANELAVALGLPLFIPRSSKYPATVKSFLAKLHRAGDALKQLSPNAILLIIIDAADNSVTAAEAADSPSERPFVFDLFGANLAALPDNVRIITSCRTARRTTLKLPQYIPEVICPPFTLAESRQHLEINFSAPSDALVEQFHNLSSANPRVQAYAIRVAAGDRTQLLSALLPGGKSLPDILRASFDNALVKLGRPEMFNKLVGVLGSLPAPIAVSPIARIVGCTEDTVRDFTLDLAPGLRLHGNSVTIADEDFDAFIKEQASVNRNRILREIAADFITTFRSDPYSAIHVADILIAAGRSADILSVIERDPQVTAVSDPIVRRQVQLRRLKLSLASCREAGSTTDALKTVLISAEAERDESTLNEVLEKELDLSVEFAGSSLRRTILLDRDRVEEHGSFLAQDAVRAIRSGDRVTAREQLHFHEAWLTRRREIDKNDLENWTVTDGDISARVETILELAGPKAAFHELMRWAPRDVALRVVCILVPHLLAAGKINHIKALLKEYPRSGPWDLLLWVPLSMTGAPVDGLAIEKSLRRIKRRFIPWEEGIRTFGEEGWKEKLLATFITACELAFKTGIDKQLILRTTNRILEVLEGNRQRRLFASDVYRFDGLLRCWLLREALSGRVAKDDNFISYVKTLSPETKPEEGQNTKGQRKRKTAHRADDQEFERLSKKIKVLLPVYEARLLVLNCARDKQLITDDQLDKLSRVDSYSYDLDYDHDGKYLREIAAQSVMSLMILDNISASELDRKSSELAQGRFGDPFATSRRKLWAKMRFRTSESDKLVISIAKAAEDIKGLREASSEKMAAIINLSRLILPVSRDDAQPLFNEAISIAKEIDREAFDQIDFVSVLAEHAGMQDQHDRRVIAADIFAFVSGAAVRLSGQDAFPWTSAVHALTCVDESSALAAICRWADDNTATLDYTLARFLLTGLQRNIISPDVAISLDMLIDGSYGDLRKELISRAAVNPQESKQIIEELAKETLLFSPQEKRLPLGQEIIDRIPQADNTQREWLAQLKDTVLFLKNATRKTEDEEAIRSGKSQQLANGHELPKEFVFDPQGKSFTTSEAIGEVLKTASASGLRYHDLDLLKRMRDASSSPKDRVPFLNAVSGVPEDLIWGGRGPSRFGSVGPSSVSWLGPLEIGASVQSSSQFFAV